jgi:hypothetical protein
VSPTITDGTFEITHKITAASNHNTSTSVTGNLTPIRIIGSNDAAVTNFQINTLKVHRPIFVLAGTGINDTGNFGSIEIGDALPVAQTFTLYNNAAAETPDLSLSASETPGFDVLGLPDTLAAGTSVQITVAPTAENAGTYTIGSDNYR